MSQSNASKLFEFFNELGIINQLASNRFERVLPDGLTLSQFSVLNNFARLGGTRTPAQLASAFQVTRGAMTNTLKKLAARGAVEMRPDPEDGRGKIVRITPKGLALREQAVQRANSELIDLGNTLDPQWVSDVLPELKKLRADLDRARDDAQD